MFAAFSSTRERISVCISTYVVHIESYILYSTVKLAPRMFAAFSYMRERSSVSISTFYMDFSDTSATANERR